MDQFGMDKGDWQEWIRKSRRVSKGDNNPPAEKGTFGRNLNNFLHARLEAEYFALLRENPEFASLDRQRTDLESLLTQELGGGIMALIERYIDARIECERLRAPHAYCQGLLDGARLMRIFSDPEKGMEFLKMAISRRDSQRLDHKIGG
ncbi:MAG: hypothetical protein K6U74_07795 [Firmicutes bacterium]|nr:hypothetical protein [Bacillota bacterium]